MQKMLASSLCTLFCVLFLISVLNVRLMCLNNTVTTIGASDLFTIGFNEDGLLDYFSKDVNQNNKDFYEEIYFTIKENILLNGTEIIFTTKKIETVPTGAIL